MQRTGPLRDGRICTLRVAPALRYASGMADHIKEQVDDALSDFSDIMDLVHGAVESAAGLPLQYLTPQTITWLWQVEAALKDILQI